MRGNPLTGVGYFWRGFMSLKEAGLRRYVALPMMLNIILMGGFSWWGLMQLDALIQALLGWLPSWLSWFTWILLPLGVLTLLWVFIYAFVLVLNLLASPFNGLLSEALEYRQTGQRLPDEALPSLMVRTVKRELTKIRYFMPRYVLLLVLSFIPLINVISPLLWFLFGAWVLTLQYLDYAMDNHGHSFEQLLAAMRKQPLTVLGFGSITALCFMVPIVNLLVMPAAVCGATLYWLEQLQEQPSATGLK